MKRLLRYIRKKLSIRVSLWVVLFAAIIFSVALGFLFYQARDAVRLEAINRATQILDKTSKRVEGILNRVEVASNMTKWLVLRHNENADSMFVYSRSMLLNNPDFYNCSIGTRAATSQHTRNRLATACARYRAEVTTTNTSTWIGILCPCCLTSHVGQSLISTLT